METAPSPPLPARRGRRWLPRFSLRMLVVAMTVLGLVLGYAGRVWQGAKHQRSVVAKIETAGGRVGYDYEFGLGEELLAPEDYAFTTIHVEADGRRKRTRLRPEGEFTEIETPPGPKLIRQWLGEDIIARVEMVDFFLPFEHERPGQFDPRLLWQLPELKVVWLWNSQVSDEWLHSVGQLQKLRVLTLVGDDESTATAEGLARLQDCATLELLAFNGEWITDDTVAGIANLRQLKYLHVTSPRITSSRAFFRHLQELTDLRVLCLGRNKAIDDQGTEQLRQLRKLKILQLMETGISDGTLAHLSGLPELEWLNVSGTNISDTGLKHLAASQELVYLDLSCTQISDNGLESLVHLVKLRRLRLASTQVTDAGMPTLARLTQLETLDLAHNSISDEGLSHLRTLKNLKRLSVGPGITYEGADQLRSALPDCQIHTISKPGPIPLPDESQPDEIEP